MSVLGAMSRKDQAPAVLPNLQAPPDTTGFFQNVSAGFEQAKAGPHSTQNARAIYESRYYDQIRQALAQEGEKATDYVESPVLPGSPFYRPVAGEQIRGGKVFVPVQRPFSNPFAEAPSITKDVNPIANFYLGGDASEIQQMWAAVQRVRQRKPGFLPQFKDQNALDAMARQQRQSDLANATDITSRANTLGTVGQFIGGAVGSIASGDPENLVGGFASAGEKAAGRSIARNIVTAAAKGSATNAAASVAAVPGQMADAQSLGQEMTAGDAAKAVVRNVVAGAILGGTHATIAPAVRATGNVAAEALVRASPHLPTAVRDPLIGAALRAGTIKDRNLLTAWARSSGAWTTNDTSTPTEKAAAHTIVQHVETQEQSPLHPEAAGANDQRLSAIANALGVDLTPPDAPTSAPVQTPTVRDRQTGGRRPASFVEGINAAEGSTRNPRSSADGYGNFIDSTWLSVAPHVTNTEGMSREQILALRHDKDVAGRATEYYAQQNGSYLRARGLEDSPGNLSLAHFLGPEGAAKVLKADPSTPVESILPADVIRANHEVLQGKSADQVVAWAHKRIGAAVDHPPARPDAVPEEGFDYSSPAPYTVETLKPDQITTDAATMQYKSGADEQGVTGILADQTAYNRLISHDLLIYRREDGTNVLVDGHQRLGLARRVDDGTLELPSLIVHEKDGITPQQARVLGALRNIANGTGSLVDNAKVLRDAPDAASMLPKSVPVARDSMGLSRLSYEAFGAAVNDVVRPEIAAQVGLNAPHSPEAHMPIIGLLAKEKITDPREAAAITRQALADGFGRTDAEQLSLLGNEPQQSLYVPIARITTAAAKRLREEKRTFKVLTEKSGKIEAAGNVLDRKANESKVIGNDEALAILERTAHRAGPVRDALVRAARSELSGTRRADAVNGFLDELGGIDLRAAAAGVGSDGSFSEPSGGAGRDLAPEAPDANLPAGSEPSLFDRAVSARDAAEPFSDPVSPEARAATDLLEHDLRADAGMKPEEPAEGTQAEKRPPAKPISPDMLRKIMGEPEPATESLFGLANAEFRLSEEGKPVTIKEALEQADADEAAAKALRDCL